VTNFSRETEFIKTTESNNTEKKISNSKNNHHLNKPHDNRNKPEEKRILHPIHKRSPKRKSESLTTQHYK
jgi:hypothetical protein